MNLHEGGISATWNKIHQSIHFFAKKLCVAAKESIFIVLNHVVNLGWHLLFYIDS